MNGTTVLFGAAVAAILVAYWAGLRVTSRRVRRELESTRSELARRLSELFSLQELAYLLSESLQIDRIVTQVARYVSRFLEVEGAAVALTSEPGTTIRIAAAEGSLAGLVGRTLSETDAAVIAAAIGQERLQVSESAAGEAPPWMSVVEARRAAAAPLRAHGVTLGALVVVDRAGGPFRDEDLRLLSTVATHAAIVLANARFFDQIRTGKEQWETTFDALAEGIAVADETGRVRRANRALAQLLGRPLPAVIGLDLATELGSAPDLLDLFTATRAGTPPPGITVESTRLGRILRIIAAPISGGGSEGWVVALVEDVTEQKAMETQLIQNEKMVAVGQLVSGVAHELNNPLTSIAGLAEFLLEQSGATTRDRDHLRVIQEQAERAGRIVRNLLTFARKGPADLGSVDLNDIVNRSVMLVEYELKLRGVQLVTEISTSPAAVRGDRYELQQVVLNLLTNAVHAVAENAPEKPRRIQVATLVTESEVIVRVSDTGPGVAPEHIAHLFSPFFTTKQPGHGTGLGLSISFGIVERHGGRLAVERSTDGATFVMSLPVTAADGRPSGAEISQPTAALAPQTEPVLPRRVLLVDDDPAVQRMIRALFSRDGQKVETPPSAIEAVRQVERESFDLIIADARAAVSEGETFASVLLNRWPTLRSRTILISADVRPETDSWLRTLGCSYFQKPFRISELKEAAAKIAKDESAYHVDI